jgi:hypothetical protein
MVDNVLLEGRQSHEAVDWATNLFIPSGHVFPSAPKFAVWTPLRSLSLIQHFCMQMFRHLFVSGRIDLHRNLASRMPKK